MNKIILDKEGKVIGIAANKETEEFYKKEGYKIITANVIDKQKTPINKVIFEVLGICRDGYECTGDKTKRKGNIISILDEFFYTELSETKVDDNYIPFVDFMKDALDYHLNESYIGGCSIELLSQLFLSELTTATYSYEILKVSKKVTKDEIISYLSSLYIRHAVAWINN